MVSGALARILDFRFWMRGFWIKVSASQRENPARD